MATTVGGPYETFVDDTSTSTSATITGLVNGTTYYFRVAAVNEVGDGAWSTSEVATPYTGAGRAVDRARARRRSTHRRHHTGLRRWQRRDRLRVPARRQRVMEVDRLDDDRLRHRRSHQRHLLRRVRPRHQRCRFEPGIGRRQRQCRAPCRQHRPSPRSPSIPERSACRSSSAPTAAARSPTSSTRSTGERPGSPARRRAPLSPVTIGGLVGGQTYPVRLRVVNDAGVQRPFEHLVGHGQGHARRTGHQRRGCGSGARRHLHGARQRWHADHELRVLPRWRRHLDAALADGHLQPARHRRSRQRHVVFRPAPGSERRRQRSASSRSSAYR